MTTESSPVQLADRPEGQTNRTAAGTWVAVFVVALALYVLTANRGADWQDAGVHHIRIVSGQIHNVRGLALTHPLHFYLGRAALHLPGLAPAMAITLISCLAGAVAVANIGALVRILTQDRVAACLAAGAIGLAHIIWHHATHTETYTLMAALLTGEWLCLLQFARTGRSKWLILLALANGLGIANHLLAALATPVDVVVLLWAWRRLRLPAGTLVLAAIAWVIGTLPYSLLVLTEGLASGEWGSVVQSALFGTFREAVLNTRIGGRMLAISAAMVLYNFPNLALPAAAAGLWHRQRVPDLVRRVLIVELVAYAVFVLRYDVVDQITFLFAAYLPLAVWTGVGIAAWRQGRRPMLLSATMALSLALTPVLYAAASRIASARGTLDAMLPRKPYRDNAATFLEPWGIKSRHADRLNAAVAELVGDKEALILVPDTMVLAGLEYARLTGQLGNQVTLMAVFINGAPERLKAIRQDIEEALSRGAVVVFVPLERNEAPPWPEDAGWEPYGEIFRIARLGAGPGR
jgi:hypothetical protein